MLLLGRRLGETIIVEVPGATIEVTVMGIKGNQVRLGITAPKTVAVDRAEIHQRKQLEKLSA